MKNLMRELTFLLGNWSSSFDKAVQTDCRLNLEKEKRKLLYLYGPKF